MKKTKNILQEIGQERQELERKNGQKSRDTGIVHYGPISPKKSTFWPYFEELIHFPVNQNLEVATI